MWAPFVKARAKARRKDTSTDQMPGCANKVVFYKLDRGTHRKKLVHNLVVKWFHAFDMGPEA
jgi:hypothetical protein